MTHEYGQSTFHRSIACGRYAKRHLILIVQPVQGELIVQEVVSHSNVYKTGQMLFQSMTRLMGTYESNDMEYFSTPSVRVGVTWVHQGAVERAPWPG